MSRALELARMVGASFPAPTDCGCIFRAEQLESFYAAASEDGLREAAEVCRSLASGLRDSHDADIADELKAAILALTQK